MILFFSSFVTMAIGATMNYVQNGDIKMFILWIAGCVLNLLFMGLLQIKNEINKNSINYKPFSKEDV